MTQREQTPPPPFAPALYLAETEQHITAPIHPGTAPLPPSGGLRWLGHHFRRIAPGLVTSAAWGLAAAWHEQLEAGSTEPLWLMGVLTALSGATGLVAASRQHGSSGVMTAAFGAGAAFGLLGIAAWTPHWPVRVLMWLLGIAAVYGLCVPHWRKDRQLQSEHERTIQLEQLRGLNSLRDTALKTSAAVEIAHSAERTAAHQIDAIVAASEARTQEALLARDTRSLAPGQELDVKALLRAAGHTTHHDPQQLAVSAQDDDFDLEALWHATADAPREPSAAERESRGRR
ncbi:hypothetical protein [Streptomyces rugosispiralis]|uniref:Uncharacterized protein n=1 Tax=Streptomyces rugosispiralis TaxID=2967341 RepID=A0ABT1VB92_9ACTN|nr:hypothetical protein [Streptomyces rugosispiralis]MCQ8194663.1 hypothetical protein [Streptomyces rugosispiralis]